ncbi:hypothetical protein L873DRAFT_1347728 [Choiromyces venosus 120613-1]|uniref:Secreted protein n=1 Tax=Choiromyces venosus 120613-1 TaxID=1336337 RepID=A0A3N4K1F0_9PEZI|nr:hypothetical protein L873DRAFT_1347728 [Choiromyces venosus 120613-1]
MEEVFFSFFFFFSFFLHFSTLRDTVEHFFGHLAAKREKKGKKKKRKWSRIIACYARNTPCPCLTKWTWPISCKEAKHHEKLARRAQLYLGRRLGSYTVLSGKVRLPLVRWDKVGAEVMYPTES